MTVSFTLDDIDSKIVTSYAEKNGMSIAELFRNIVIEHIEDEYDRKIYDEAYSEYIKSGEKGTPISELWKELDL